MSMEQDLLPLLKMPDDYSLFLINLPLPFTGQITLTFK